MQQKEGTMGKSYSELQFTDDFMFWNVLVRNPNLCKELLELILNISIREIRLFEGQKTIEPKYDSRGIRLDVYVNDDENTVYDLEMQTTLKRHLAKRMRYYQGMIDLNLIQRGDDFSVLKKSYIIFLCTGDPFGRHIPTYSFENVCKQDTSLTLNDETVKIVINPDSDRTNLSREMNSFLDLLQGKRDVDGLAERLQNAVEEAKEHKELEVEYMTLQMKLREEREEGREEGRTETKIMTAKRMLAMNLDIKIIAEACDFSEDEILALRQESGRGE